MERFAIKIDDAVKSNLYSICRLCGIDYPKKVSIIDALTLLGINEPNEDEPDLCRKITVCVGIKVTKNDQMPQTVCQLCADKINDFYEYREMCSATNIQTRKLLGLPDEPIKPMAISGTTRKRKKKVEEAESILGDPEPEIDDKKDIKILPSTSGGKKKNEKKSKPTRKQQSQAAVIVIDSDTEIKEEFDIKTETDTKDFLLTTTTTSKNKKSKQKGLNGPALLQPKELNKREQKRENELKKNSKKKRNLSIEENVDVNDIVKRLKTENISCSVCYQEYVDVAMFNEHMITVHTPTIFEYGCSSCGEYFKTADEQKDHQIWHSLSQTLYNCHTCQITYDKWQTYTRHRSYCKELQEKRLQSIYKFPCSLCGQEFATQNLHDWHGCFMRKNGHCLRCKKQFVNKTALVRHAVRCSVPRPPDEAGCLDQHYIDPLENVQVTMDTELPATTTSATVKKSIKLVEGFIKSEPETTIDDRIIDSENLLRQQTADLCTDARVQLTPLKPNEISKLMNENDDFNHPLFDHDDGHFGDDGNSSADEMHDSNDVLPIEKSPPPKPVSISSDSSPEKNVKSTKLKPKKLKSNLRNISIKQEPIDPVFDAANIRIKQEPIDSFSYAHLSQPAVVVGDLPDHLFSAQRKEKKSKQKPKKDRRPNVEKSKHLQPIQIKQEPQMDGYPAEVSTIVHMSNNLMATQTTQSTSQPTNVPTALTVNIKKEPHRPEYDLYDPTVAMNIKQEKCTDSVASSKQPSLRLKITKNRGTLNSQILPDIVDGSTDSPLTSASPTNATENPLENPPENNESEKQTKSKILYKKPALLAQKIREEILARIAQESGGESSQDSSSPATVTLPIISQVSAADGTQISLNSLESAASSVPPIPTDFSTIRIKQEKLDDGYPDDDDNDDDTNYFDTFDRSDSNQQHNTTKLPQKVLNPLARILQMKLNNTLPTNNEIENNENENNENENNEIENNENENNENVAKNTLESDIETPIDDKLESEQEEKSVQNTDDADIESPHEEDMTKSNNTEEVDDLIENDNINDNSNSAKVEEVNNSQKESDKNELLMNEDDNSTSSSTNSTNKSPAPIDPNIDQYNGLSENVLPMEEENKSESSIKSDLPPTLDSIVENSIVDCTAQKYDDDDFQKVLNDITKHIIPEPESDLSPMPSSSEQFNISLAFNECQSSVNNHQIEQQQQQQISNELEPLLNNDDDDSIDNIHERLLNDIDATTQDDCDDKIDWDLENKLLNEG